MYSMRVNKTILSISVENCMRSVNYIYRAIVMDDLRGSNKRRISKSWCTDQLKIYSLKYLQ